MRATITALLWFGAMGCGLMAGLYFAFSAFVMTALGKLDAAAGAAAMNSINTTIVRTAFMPLFLLTSLASLALAAIGAFHFQEPGAWLWASGGASYFFGMFLVTLRFNVPLNNRLAATQRADVEETWRAYRVSWTRWNHVRTLASLLASALFVAALIRAG